jgi:hypothetical protein
MMYGGQPQQAIIVQQVPHGGMRGFIHQRITPSSAQLQDGNKAIGQDRWFYFCCGTLCMLLSPLTLCATIGSWPCMLALGMRSCTYTQDSRKSCICCACLGLIFITFPLLIFAMGVGSMVAGQPPTCFHGNRARCTDCIPNITAETMEENRDANSNDDVHAQWVFPYLDTNNHNWRWVTNSWNRGTEVERRDLTNVDTPNWPHSENVEGQMQSRWFVEDDEAGLWWPEESRESCLHGPGRISPDTLNTYDPNQNVGWAQAIKDMPEGSKWTSLGTFCENEGDECFERAKYPLSLTQGDVSGTSPHMNALLQPKGTVTGSFSEPNPATMFAGTSMLPTRFWSPSGNGGASDKRSNFWHLNEWYSHYFMTALSADHDTREGQIEAINADTTRQELAYRVPFKTQFDRNLLDLTQEYEDREQEQHNNNNNNYRNLQDEPIVMDLYPPEFEWLCRDDADFSGQVMEVPGEEHWRYQGSSMNSAAGQSPKELIPSCGDVCSNCFRGTFLDLRGLGIAILMWSILFFWLSVFLCCKYGFSYNLATRAEYDGKQRAQIAQIQGQAFAAQQQNFAMQQQMQMQQMQMQAFSQQQQAPTVIVNNNMTQPMPVLPGQALTVEQQLAQVKQ